MFCDYYNPPDKHEWFYKPCGAPCLKTCRNPKGKCGNLLYSLEGNSWLTLVQFMRAEAISWVLNVLSIKVAESLPHLPQKCLTIPHLCDGAIHSITCLLPLNLGHKRSFNLNLQRIIICWWTESIKTFGREGKRGCGKIIGSINKIHTGITFILGSKLHLIEVFMFCPWIHVKQTKNALFTLTFQAVTQSVALTSHILMRRAGNASPSPTALHGRSVDDKRERIGWEMTS